MLCSLDWAQSEDYAANLRTAMPSLDMRFVHDYPWIVLIRTLCIAYIYTYITTTKLAVYTAFTSCDSPVLIGELFSVSLQLPCIWPCKDTHVVGIVKHGTVCAASDELTTGPWEYQDILLLWLNWYWGAIFWWQTLPDLKKKSSRYVKRNCCYCEAPPTGHKQHHICNTQ